MLRLKRSTVLTGIKLSLVPRKTIAGGSSFEMLCAGENSLYLSPTRACPQPQDRVHNADQNTNPVSGINPATTSLLGQIRLGNVRPVILSPLYKGEINVHGLGFSPDHRTLIAISNGSAPTS